jgi:hypothetical protein
MQPSEKHSVQVSVRIRPGFGIEAREAAQQFVFPANVIEGSDQASASAALLGRLVQRFIKGGTSCTLMAYGQTGSGKTYTMFGPTGALTEASLEQAANGVPKAWGAFPRAMMELLQAEELTGAKFHASAVEIYMEHAYDLLDGRKPVKVGTAKGSGRGTLVVADIGKAPVWSGDVQIVGGVHPSGCSCFQCFQKTGGLVGGSRLKKAAAAAAAAGDGAAAAKKPGVPRLSKVVAKASKDVAAAASAGVEQFGTEGETLWPIQTPADVARMARLVESERVAHSHALNDRSSRSHCLIRVNCTHLQGGTHVQKRTFVFVDLAGSERISKTAVTGAMQKEAANINQSLTALGRVVKELNEHSAHVSYRDSALTMLLRASFCGPSCTSVVINVSGDDAHAEETVCSLRFGEKLACVQTSAAIAQPTDVGAQRARVGAELAAARAKLDELERAGQGDHILPNALPSEQRTLRTNLETLAEREAEVRALKVQLVEARAAGQAASELKARLDAATEKRDMILDIVEKEKTIKTLWHPATPAYQRAATQVAQLAAQLEMLST